MRIATPQTSRNNPFKRAARVSLGKPAVAPVEAAPAAPSLLDMPDPVDWIERNFYLYDTQQLISLYPVQVTCLNEAMRRDESGRFVYSTVCWSWPKKSGKSSIVAAVCMYMAVNKPRASIKLIANDLEQADSKVGMYVREAVKLHPVLRDTTKISISGYSITFANGSVIKMIPIDPEGEAGGNDDIIVYSELWGWKSKAHQKMWQEMTLSPNKFGTSQRWIDTYAGEDGESPVLQDLIYKPSVKPENQLYSDLEVYAYLPARMLTVWITKHLLPWQQGEEGAAYYAEQATTLTQSAFDRMHWNKWATATGAYLSIDWWNACKLDTLPTMDKYLQLAVGIDAAVSDDCFGIVAVSRHGKEIAVRFVKAWYPQGNKLWYTNPMDKFDIDYPEGTLRDLARRYNVIIFSYDPMQLHHLCTSLRNDGVGLFQEFSQGADRLEADKQLLDVIKARKIMHTGDPELTAHLQNANRQEDGEGHKLRIVKRNNEAKIDLAVSLSMAVHSAYRYLSE